MKWRRFAVAVFAFAAGFALAAFGLSPAPASSGLSPNLFTSTSASRAAPTASSPPLPCECSRHVPALVDYSLSKWGNISAANVREGIAAMKRHGDYLLAGFILRIENGQIFLVRNYPGAESRNDAMLMLFWAAAQRGLEGVTTTLVVNTQDRNTDVILPTAPGDARPVVLSFSRKEEHADVLVPDYSFISWPEVGHPAWKTKFESILAAGNLSTNPFRMRKSMALFAGRKESKMRYDGAGVAERHPDAFKFTIGVSNENQCGYKYLVYFEGGGLDSGAYSSRLKYLLLCGSVALMPVGKTGPTWFEYFFPIFEPWKHYVPFNEDLSDLVDVIKRLQRDDDLSERIARAGQELATEVLSPKSVTCFVKTLLKRYAALAPSDDFAAGIFPRKDYRPLEEVMVRALDTALK